MSEARVDVAIARRAALLADPPTTAIRIIHDAADGLPGLVLEKFGDVLIAQLHEGRLTLAEDVVRKLCETARQRLGCTAVYRKLFPRERSTALSRLDNVHRDAQPWLGAPCAPEIAVLENGLQFLVRPYDGYSVGLFLERRDDRARVRALAAGRRVLNTFAYTCGFSVAAAAGGAASTVNVDASKRYLEWGKRNFAANGLALEAHVFICSDTLDYFPRARRQGRLFDLIILDPPTFGRSKQTGRAFSIADDLSRLVSEALTVLAQDGVMLLATNHRGLPLSRLERSLADAARAAGRSYKMIAGPPLPADFPDDPEYAQTLIVRVG